MDAECDRRIAADEFGANSWRASWEFDRISLRRHGRFLPQLGKKRRSRAGIALRSVANRRRTIREKFRPDVDSSASAARQDGDDEVVCKFSEKPFSPNERR